VILAVGCIASASTPSPGTAGQVGMALRSAGAGAPTVAAAPAAATPPASRRAPKKTLRAFASDREIADLLKRWVDAQPPGTAWPRHGAGQSPPMAAAPPAAELTVGGKVALSADSLVNVQHAGVGEGGIVGRHGDHLVILRRGRLFTVRVGGNDLAPVAAVDAYGATVDPTGARYDEMLIRGDTIGHGVRPGPGRAGLREHGDPRAPRARLLRLGPLGVPVDGALAGASRAGTGGRGRVSPAPRWRRAHRPEGPGQPDRPVLLLTGTPRAQDRYTRPGAAQGETRSHGFFYRPQGESEGIVGLPIIGGGRAAARQLTQESAAVLFLCHQRLRLTELGALASWAGAGTDDGCRASCVDWYGNSRPLFLGSRVFALMGYEMAGSRLAEVRRISFSPGRPTGP
jgi:hypothetical protein